MLSIRIRVLVLVIAAAALSGCGMSFRLEMNPPPDTRVAPEPSPLHAGIYYSPKFASEELVRRNGPHSYTAPIGAASVKMFNATLGRVFRTTTLLSSLSAEEIAARGVDVVIAPTLVHFDFRLGMVADSERYSVLYRVTLHTAAGVPAASWLVPGNAAETRSNFWASPNAALAMMIEDDMVAARAKFLQEFAHNAGPALAAIAQARATPPAAIEAREIAFAARRSTLPGVKPEDAQALREAGFVAFEVSAENRGGKPLVMRSSDMRLRLSDGRALEPATVSSALAAIEKVPNNVGAAMLFGPLIAVALDIAQMQDQQAERDLQVKVGNQAIFNERTVAAGNPERGLVLFRLPEGVKSVNGAKVAAWMVDPAAAQGVQVDAKLDD